jgi:hypothetical protein
MVPGSQLIILLCRVFATLMVHVLVMMACAAVTVPFLALVASKIPAMGKGIENLQSKIPVVLKNALFQPCFRNYLISILRSILAKIEVELYICRKVLLQRQHVLVNLAGWNLHKTILKSMFSYLKILSQLSHDKLDILSLNIRST